MKPISMEIQGFGPFVEPLKLDFTKLDKASIFLICGPTGAGKTSILDAICYALFGVSSGGDRETKEIRSHLSKPGDPTRVTFEFSLGPQRFRVMRQLAFMRPKKRGDGEIEEGERAELYRAAVREGNGEPSFEPVETQSRRVTEAIIDILGFKAEQFRQVVILPQGKFREWLLATSAEREGILKMLFQTQLYERIQEALKVRSRDLQASLERESSARKIHLEDAGADSQEGLKALIKEGEGRYTEIVTRVNSLRQEEKKASQSLEKGRVTNRLLAEKKEAQGQLESLNGRAGEFKIKSATLEKGRRVEPLAAMESELARSLDSVKALAGKIDEAGAELSKSVKVREKASWELSAQKEKEAEIRKLEIELANYGRYQGILQALVLERKTMEEAQAGLKACEKEEIDEDRRLKEAISSLEGKQAALRKSLPAARDLERLKNESEKIARVIEKRKLLEDALTRLAGEEKLKIEADTRGREIDALLKSAREKLSMLQEAWNKGSAGILAASLEEGRPCPVCGSLSHPAPAASGQDTPSEDSLKKAAEKLRKLEAEKDEISGLQRGNAANHARFAARVETLQADLAGFLDEPLKSIESQKARIQKELKKSESAASLAQRLEKEIEELTAKREQLQKSLGDSVQRLGQAWLRLKEAQAGLEAREGEIPAGYRDEATLKAAIKDASSTISSWQQKFARAEKESQDAEKQAARWEATLKSHEAACVSARELLDRLSREFEGKLKDAGFKDRAEYGELKKISIPALEKEIGDYEGRLKAARERLERAGKQAEGLEMVDMDALEKSHATAMKAWEHERDEKVRMEERGKKLLGIFKKIEDLDARIGTLDMRYRIVKKLSETARGGNSLNLSFQRFVLASLFDEVLFMASKRLEVMSRRRYQLRRADSPADRRTSGGLNIEVLDAYTGTARPVSTLSGGESFLASLSLALGLSEMVQSRTGGIHLDTIYVDEGFGSLDPDSLELAFQALIDLGVGGRQVGIISHVPELKERIDARLEVTPSPRGSRAAIKSK